MSARQIDPDGRGAPIFVRPENVKAAPHRSDVGQTALHFAGHQLSTDFNRFLGRKSVSLATPACLAAALGRLAQSYR